MRLRNVAGPRLNHAMQPDQSGMGAENNRTGEPFRSGMGYGVEGGFALAGGVVGVHVPSSATM